MAIITDSVQYMLRGALLRFLIYENLESDHYANIFIFWICSTRHTCWVRHLGCFLTNSVSTKFSSSHYLFVMQETIANNGPAFCSLLSRWLSIWFPPLSSDDGHFSAKSNHFSCRVQFAHWSNYRNRSYFRLYLIHSKIKFQISIHLLSPQWRAILAIVIFVFCNWPKMIALHVPHFNAIGSYVK